MHRERKEDEYIPVLISDLRKSKIGQDEGSGRRLSAKKAHFTIDPEPVLLSFERDQVAICFALPSLVINL